MGTSRPRATATATPINGSVFTMCDYGVSNTRGRSCGVMVENKETEIGHEDARRSARRPHLYVLELMNPPWFYYQ